jgi:predicted dehydrogenase
MMAGDKIIGVGVIGLGFMGATHIAAYQSAAAAQYPCKLLAVCDRKPHRRNGQMWDVGGNAVSDVSAQKLAFDPALVAGYESPEALLNDERIDLVSICTRTDTHVQLAAAAVRKNKHVLVEKPVSLSSDEIRSLISPAERAGKYVMPAMCLRFWPAWAWLKQRMNDRRFGSLKSLTLTRLASIPQWSPFYSDGQRSGGAIFDLHVHDADFVQWSLGRPESVFSSGVAGPSGAVDHVTTIYGYPDQQRHVVAEGGWNQHDGFAYRMRYVAVFEQATADYELTSAGERLSLCREGRADKIDLPKINGYDAEVRHLLDLIAGKEKRAQVSLEDAIAVNDLLHAERESVRRRQPVQLRT